MVKYLYIIGRGEFEVTIRTQENVNTEEEDIDDQKIIGFLRPAESKIVSCTQNGSVKANQNNQVVNKIVLLGPGNMLGLEDIARISPHSYSVKCVSQTGTILKMEVDKFHNFIKHLPNGFA